MDAITLLRTLLCHPAVLLGNAEPGASGIRTSLNKEVYLMSTEGCNAASGAEYPLDKNVQHRYYLVPCSGDSITLIILKINNYNLKS